MTDLPTRIQAVRLAYDKMPSPELKAEIDRLEAEYAAQLVELFTGNPGSFKKKAG